MTRISHRNDLRHRTLPGTVLGVTLVLTQLVAAAQGQPRNIPDDGAYRGYFAAHALDNGELDVIDAHNNDRLFVPASVLKVLTVAAALEHLSGDYRWRTQITSTGAIVDRILEGNLVVEPGADPTWGTELFDGGAGEPLTRLAEQVVTGGVTRVIGDLVVDMSRFPGRRYPLDRAFSDLPYRHGTPPAALAVNEATVSLRVAPGAMLGAPARVTSAGRLEVINRTITVSRDRQGAGTLDFLPIWDTEMLLLRGEYPISERPFIVAASDPIPEVRAARELQMALARAGVNVGGDTVARTQSANRTGRRLIAELQSPPLRDILGPLLTRSHNWFADMLVLTLSREEAGSGRFDDGVQVVSDFVTDVLGEPVGRGTTPTSVSLRDGSGLSAANLVTPTAVARVLAHALARPWGPTLVAALPRPGQGTLAAWPRLPPVAAKTGTLRQTIALAGVLEPDGASPVVFCYFVNHHPGRRAEARAEIARAVRRWQNSR